MPPTRWIVVDDNTRFEIDQDLLVGRDPDRSNATKLGLRAVRVDDPSSEMSRSHMEVRIFNGEVVITDRNSANGTSVRESGQQAWNRLAPWSSVKWTPGMSVRIGGRTLRLELTAAQAPQMRPRADVHHGGPRQPHDGPEYAAACSNIPRV